MVRIHREPPFFRLIFPSTFPSSRGLGHLPFTEDTGVQIPLGTPNFKNTKPESKDSGFLFSPSDIANGLNLEGTPCGVHRPSRMLARGCRRQSRSDRGPGRPEPHSPNSRRYVKINIETPQAPQGRIS